MLDGRLESVKVGLPRFNFDVSLNLMDALGKMGMSNSFDSAKADYSGIAKMSDLAVTDIIHSARIKVNEEGTEAAAAKVWQTMGVSPEKEILFHVNRPFLFFIVDRPTGVILFLGTVNEPEIWKEKGLLTSEVLVDIGRYSTLMED